MLATLCHLYFPVVICVESQTILKSSAINLEKKKKKESQKLNSIDSGGVGVIPNHGNALNYVSVAILVMQYTCILVALP